MARSLKAKLPQKFPTLSLLECFPSLILSWVRKVSEAPLLLTRFEVSGFRMTENEIEILAWEALQTIFKLYDEGEIGASRLLFAEFFQQSDWLRYIERVVSPYLKHPEDRLDFVGELLAKMWGVVVRGESIGPQRFDGPSSAGELRSFIERLVFVELRRQHRVIRRQALLFEMEKLHLHLYLSPGSEVDILPADPVLRLEAREILNDLLPALIEHHGQATTMAFMMHNTGYSFDEVRSFIRTETPPFDEVRSFIRTETPPEVRKEHLWTRFYEIRQWAYDYLLQRQDVPKVIHRQAVPKINRQVLRKPMVFLQLSLQLKELDPDWLLDCHWPIDKARPRIEIHADIQMQVAKFVRSSEFTPQDLSSLDLLQGVLKTQQHHEEEEQALLLVAFAQGQGLVHYKQDIEHPREEDVRRLPTLEELPRGFSDDVWDAYRERLCSDASDVASS